MGTCTHAFSPFAYTWLASRTGLRAHRCDIDVDSAPPRNAGGYEYPPYERQRPPKKTGRIARPVFIASNSDYTRFIRKVVSSGTGRPVAPFCAPLFQAVPAMSRWAQV